MKYKEAIKTFRMHSESHQISLGEKEGKEADPATGCI